MIDLNYYWFSIL